MSGQAFDIETFSRKPLMRRRQHYFRFVNRANGKTIAVSEGYFNEADMLATLRGIKANAADAPIVKIVP